MPQKEWILSEWSGCYDKPWKGICVDDAFQHPAKFSAGLIDRIYRHLRESYGVVAGSVVVDPFGGVGLGALGAMQIGAAWFGCELEPRFHELAQKNLQKWAPFYPGGVARIVCGDSRKLRQNLSGQLADVVLSSPPYATIAVNDDQRTMHGKQLKPGPNSGDGRTYGNTQGNISTLEAGEVDAVVSSPPYGGSVVVDGRAVTDQQTHTRDIGSMDDLVHGYGETEGQLAGEDGETFWAASKQIVRECFEILKHGGVAVWVVKDYVRDKKRVRFCDDWRRLCESVGFETVEEVHASLVKEVRSRSLFGDEVVKRKERKSFFRRLAESKMDESDDRRINHETVWFMIKPTSNLQPPASSRTVEQSIAWCRVRRSLAPMTELVTVAA